MPITLIENFRAAFYAPFYAALALGEFAREKLDVVVKPSSDFRRAIENLVAGEGEVSWGGPLRLMQGLDRDPPKKPVTFCEVVGRDPFFLIGRKPNPQFKLSDLLSVTLSVATEVPTPWLCLQHDLRLAGLDPSRVKLRAARTMAENAAALRSGDAEVIQIFQPFAKDLELSSAGHVWYAAATRGPTSYTTLNTTREYAKDHPQVLIAMCRAMARTLKWVHAHDGRELAALIHDYFPDVDPRVIASAFDDYLKLGLWNESPIMSRQGLEWLRDAGLGGGFLKRKHAYEDVFDAQYAEAALR